MNFITETNRIFSTDENGKVIAEITFPEVSEGVFEIDHTFVDDSLRGQGIAGQIVSLAADEIEKRGGKITASCSYAKHWLEKNGKL